MSRELRMKSPLEKLHSRAAQLARGRSALAASSYASGDGSFGADGSALKSQEQVYFGFLEELLAQYLDELVDENILDGVAA